MPTISFQAPHQVTFFFKFSLVAVLLSVLAGCITTPQNNERSDSDPIASTIANDPARQGSPLSAKEKREMDAYVSYITKHYSISKKGARIISEAVMAESKKQKVDKSLITAVIAVESRFHPYAVSRSNAEGLMQIIPRWHPEKMAKIGGEEKVVDTRKNIAAGTSALKEYLIKHNQNVPLALQQYNGSLSDPSRRYSNKVLSEKRRIEQWIASRN